MEEIYICSRFSLKAPVLLVLCGLFLILNIEKIEAQEFVWAKKTTVPAGISIKSFLNDNNDNSYFFGSGSAGSYLNKYDEIGNSVFQKDWKTTFHINDVKFNNGYFYVTGNFSDSITIDGITIKSVGNSDGFVGQIDLSGTFKWIKTFGTKMRDLSNGIFIDPMSKNLIITGVVKEYMGGGVDTSQIFISSYSENGDLLLEKELNYFDNYPHGGNQGVEIASEKVKVEWKETEGEDKVWLLT